MIHEVAQKVAAILEQRGFENIQIVVEEERGFCKMYFVELNPAADYYYRHHQRAMHADRHQVRTWILNNAYRTYGLTIDPYDFNFRFHGQADWYANRLANEFEHAWLNGLAEIHSEVVEQREIRIPEPPERSRISRFLSFLNRVTQPRVIYHEDMPKGIYPSTGEPVK